MTVTLPYRLSPEFCRRALREHVVSPDHRAASSLRALTTDTPHVRRFARTG